MLDDIISQFANNKNINQFDFSLRPTHDIDNPYTKISLNIIENLENSLTKADKNALVDVLLDEAEENINFSYKIYSQITDMTPEEEGLLFKARMIEILNDLENQYDEECEEIEDLFQFVIMLSNMAEKQINEEKLKNAFITNMLLFEVLEEMKIRNIYTPFIAVYKDYLLSNPITLMHVIATKLIQKNDKELTDFVMYEMLQYINRFDNDRIMDICFDMLYCASLLTDENTADTILKVANTVKNHSQHISPKTLLGYIKSGIAYKTKSSEEFTNFVCENVSKFHCINNIANTCLLLDKPREAEKILEYSMNNKRLPKHSKMDLYDLLQTVYSLLNETKKFADISKVKFALGDTNAFFDAIKAYTEVGLYDKERDNLHQIACKQIPVYDYCCLLADHKEYNLLIERVNMIKSLNDVSEAIRFMDDKGITLYDNETNKKLLEILSQKTRHGKVLSKRISDLQSLISL